LAVNLLPDFAFVNLLRMLTTMTIKFNGHSLWDWRFREHHLS